MGYTWRKGGQSNGGYCNAIAADPNRSGSLVACGDVWGFAASVDSGDHWYPTNLGQSPARPYGRCAVFSRKHPGRCYVGVGTLKYANGEGGGYLGVIDPAESGSPYRLDRVNTKVSFTSYLPKGGAGDLPRPTGKLLAIDYDEASGVEYLYALTRQGLMRSTDGGATMTPLGLAAPAPLFAWSCLFVQPNGNLLVSTFRTSDTGGSKMFQVKDPRGAAVVAELSGFPPVIEDIALIEYEGHKFTMLACGQGGVLHYGGMVSLPADPDRHISTITQGADGSAWIGNGVGSDAHECIARSLDGCASWEWVTPAAACKPTILGTDRRYWLADEWSFMGKGSGFSVAQLVESAGTVYVAGRSGVWASRDGGESWAPCCNGLDGSESNAFAVQGGEVWASDTDYKSSHSSDGFVNADQDKHPPTFQARALKRTAGDGSSVEVTTGNPPRILVDGVDVADDYARSALVNPKDVLVDAAGRIYIALSGGVLVGDPA